MTMTPFGLVVMALGIAAFLPLVGYGAIELYRIIKQYLKAKKVNDSGYRYWYS